MALGRSGERLAAKVLEDAGMTVIDRNWSCRHGEIDLVALDDGTLVIVEVKTRRSTRYGSPVEAVVPAKLSRLRRLSGIWIEEHRRQLGRVRNVRIDVVAVWWDTQAGPTIKHLVGVS